VKRGLKRAAAAVFGLAIAGGFVIAPGCSLGQGTGEVKSDKLFAHDCWGHADAGPSAMLDDGYDLKPDFFAAIPYRSTLEIRVQRGNDLQEISDGISVLVDDVPKIRAALDQARRMQQFPDAGVPDAGDAGAPDAADAADAADAGPSPDGGEPDDNCDPEGKLEKLTGPHADGTATFQVSLPAGVTPPGSPAVPPPDLLADPPLVHMALYLQRSCHNQNTVLYAVSGTVTFSSLFSGDPNETSAAEKLIEVTAFNVQVGDLRDVPLGQYPREIPCNLQSNLYGSFRFYFDRGRPAQPFP
jgi:hypothetical protein